MRNSSTTFRKHFRVTNDVLRALWSRPITVADVSKWAASGDLPAMGTWYCVSEFPDADDQTHVHIAVPNRRGKIVVTLSHTPGSDAIDVDTTQNGAPLEIIF